MIRRILSIRDAARGWPLAPSVAGDLVQANLVDGWRTPGGATFIEETLAREIATRPRITPPESTWILRCGPLVELTKDQAKEQGRPFWGVDATRIADGDPDAIRAVDRFWPRPRSDRAGAAIVVTVRGMITAAGRIRCVEPTELGAIVRADWNGLHWAEVGAWLPTKPGGATAWIACER